LNIVPAVLLTYVLYHRGSLVQPGAFTNQGKDYGNFKFSFIQTPSLFLCRWALPSWEQSESRYTAPPPPRYTDAQSSRRTKLNMLAYLGLGDAISPRHPGHSPSNFSVSPAESDSEQEVIKNTQANWVFDAGSDCEKWKCHRSTSSAICGSAVVIKNTQANWVFDAGSDCEKWKCHRSTSSTGASCTRCHTCIWTRAKYRERVGAHRTLEMMSV